LVQCGRVKYRWNVLPCESEQALSLCRQLNVPELIGRFLVQRGLTDPDEARRFLCPKIEDLHEPLLMADMDRALNRLRKARLGGEKILIYGDYDADGITSTVVLKRALEMLGFEVDYYLPRRLEEGYGVQPEVLRKARGDGFTLVITADNGIRAFEACQAARETALDVIVTDHHLPADRLPEACAVLNPLRSDCSYPDKNLAGVGVVFKLVHALFRQAEKEHLVEHFLKLVAIGTVADLVPLLGENRVIVKHGLQKLADPRNIGLRALLEGAGVDCRGVSLFDVGYRIAPRLNAVTRMGGGREVVDLFSESSVQRAKDVVRQMNESNISRQQEERRILAEIEQRMAKEPAAFQKSFLVVGGENWHRGVIGIVASRLVERFHRPVLILSLEKGHCQGSGRSIPGFHMLNALEENRDLFVRFGGHAQAVGCTLERSNCEELSRRLDEQAARQLTSEQLIPLLTIDSLLPFQEVNLALYHQLQVLAPFGIGNPIPLFASNNVEVVAGPWVLKEHHLKMHLGGVQSRLDAIWWKNGGVAGTITPGTALDVAYSLDRDVYQGEEKLLLTIRDMRGPELPGR
jgi:single-stranded-DNA-specific exonuclease